MNWIHIIRSYLSLAENLELDYVLLAETVVFGSFVVTHEVPNSLSILVRLAVNTRLPIRLHSKDKRLQFEFPKNQLVSRIDFGRVVLTRVDQVQLLIVLDK